MARMMRTDELLARAIAPGTDRHGPCVAVWFIDSYKVAVKIANEVRAELEEVIHPRGLDYSIGLSEGRHYFTIQFYVKVDGRFVKLTLSEEQLITAEVRKHLKAHHMATGIEL